MPAPSRILPNQSYNGLTIILSNPSRLDTAGLLTSAAGYRFDNEALLPHGTNRYQSEIRLADCRDGLLPGTRCILLLGEHAFRTWAPRSAEGHTLNEQRGYPLTTVVDGVQGIASYVPQEAVDYKDYEHQLNKEIVSYDDDDDDDDDGDVKRHGATRISNFFHWIVRDTGKAIWACRNVPVRRDPVVHVCPTSDEVVTELTKYRDEHLYIDIETSFVYHDLFCIGFSFGSSHSGNPIWVVPILRYNLSLTYSDYAKIFRAFSIALRHNIVVAHNSMFDLGVLAHRYSLPFGRRVYDTMLAQHRCFPEAEKSLGHSMSAWPGLWQPFHKDEGVFPPHNQQQEQQLWQYNAKDIWGMKLVHEAQLAYMADKPGLQQSVSQANSMVRPYTISQLFGMRFNEEMRKSIMHENDGLMTHYLKALKILVGHDMLPSSWQQCGKYLYEEMCYDAPFKTKTGNNATSDKALQKLKLKYPANPVLDFILRYRELAKESGQLKFTPWKTPQLNDCPHPSNLPQ